MSGQKIKQEGAGKEIQLVVFTLAGEQFGLEISQVREIIRMQNITPMPQAPDRGHAFGQKVRPEISRADRKIQDYRGRD
jgi:chemotaxis signal transduction protein